MSSIVDNITLALVSLKRYLENYLDNNNWKDAYTIFIAGDPKLNINEIKRAGDVSTTNRPFKNTDKHTQLPVIIISDGTFQSETLELGDTDGYDKITLSLLIGANDSAELRTLTNFIRRNFIGLSIVVYDYTAGGNKAQVGSATFDDIIAVNVSNPDSTVIFDKYSAVINTTMQIGASDFV